MDKKATLKPLSAAIGATFAVTMAAAPLANAAENPFSLTEFSSSGYMVAEGEGTCGEGKCGGSAGKKATEGKCAEGKCAEGKCAGKAESGEKATEGKCAEGKCAEGKCASKTEGGSSMMDKAKEAVESAKEVVPGL